MPDEQPLSTPLVGAVRELEKHLKRPVWMLIQDISSDLPQHGMGEWLETEFLRARRLLPTNKPIALVVHSAGGTARTAYKIATILRRRCGEYSVIVPEYAKSAATLLSLGASCITLGDDAELGPLDAQLDDTEREEIASALDEVQALDRLHSFALQAIDQEMVLYSRRSGKKVSSLLPDVQRFVASFMEPLLRKIDTVHYTQMSRVLKVAEEYAIRLLQPQYTDTEARRIANKLVHGYPEHGFVIDFEEASSIGLRIENMPDSTTAQLVEAVMRAVDSYPVIGCLQEVKNGTP